MEPRVIRPWSLAITVGLIVWIEILDPDSARWYAVASAPLVAVLPYSWIASRRIESEMLFALLLVPVMMLSVSGVTFAYVALGGSDGGGALHPVHPYVLVFAISWAGISVGMFLALTLAQRLVTGLWRRR